MRLTDNILEAVKAAASIDESQIDAIKKGIAEVLKKANITDDGSISIPIDDGYALEVVQEHDPSYPREVFVCLRRNDGVEQDIAYVRNQYTYTDDGDGPVYNKDCTMYCMVYADSESDDCTDTFEIKRSPYLVKEEKKHERI